MLLDAATNAGWNTLPGLTQPACIAVLAPHPDDFDAIAVTLHALQTQGHVLHVAVLTGGANGVEDGFAGAATRDEKIRLREAEQRASCAAFGLDPARLRFLRLWEESLNEAADLKTLRQWLLEVRPQAVFLPHGNDSNATHRRTYQSFRTIALQDRLRLCAYLNQDAKTREFRCDLQVGFDEARASWKKSLLRMHASQQERNLRTRGVGFDERVLAVNRDAACELQCACAEVFELERYG